ADRVASLVQQAEATRLAHALRDAPEEVRAKVAEIDLTAATGDVVEHLRASLVAHGIDDVHIELVLDHARRTNLGKGLDPTHPIADHPAVAQALPPAPVHETAAIPGPPGPAARAPAQAAPAPSTIDDATLAKLVANDTLSDAQARAVGLSASL